MSEDTSYGVTRRDALKLGAGTLAGAAASVAALQGAPLAALAAAPTDLNEATVGPLHGIPVLLKDNIDTHDEMQSAAGSLGLVGAPALQDSTVAARLRAAGAVILGKTTLSEWANFRSFFSS